MPKQLLVEGDKTFRITIPDDAKITFGPWSPPGSKTGQWNDGGKAGTLRVYQGSKENIIACFAGVRSFRDLDMGYAEQVVVQEGASIWKDDQEGYITEQKSSRKTEWVEPQKQLIGKTERTSRPKRTRS